MPPLRRRLLRIFDYAAASFSMPPRMKRYVDAVTYYAEYAYCH